MAVQSRESVYEKGMGYGRLNHRQLTALEPHIRDRQVWDLGAGDLSLAHELARLGAAKVFAVDKERLPPPLDRRVKALQCRFDELLDGSAREVVFLSWPPNHPILPLLVLAMSASIVVYLGCNLNGFSCGFHSLFDHFLHRKLLTHEPDLENTLMVYGKRCPLRNPTWEENAAIDVSQIFRYEDGPDGYGNKTRDL